jgi:NADH:ubiquinone oxidoreductase subunit 6 (subunit J)
MNIKLFVPFAFIIPTVAFFLYPLAVSVQRWNENPSSLGEPLQEHYSNNFVAFSGTVWVSWVGGWLSIGYAFSWLIGLMLGIAILIVLVGIHERIPEKKKEKNQKKLTDWN